MNFMEKLTDQNKLDLSSFIKENGRTAEELKRAQAVLLLTEGMSEAIILTMTGLKRTTAIKIRKRFLKSGRSALESKRKDKKYRDLLTKNQRTEIKNMLHTKTPRNYGWDWDYWTPTILAQLILELYAVKYKSKTSMYIIFKQSKFTYHKPEKVYQKRDQAAIDKWKTENREVVLEALRDPETVVLVEDEMIITSQTTLQKIWLPEGEQSEIVCSNVRKRRSIYGFLNIKNGIEQSFKTERQTSLVSAQCLKKILNIYKGKKVLLFWDNAPWHKGEAMRSFLDTCSDFKIINFPPYAPDENPQEHVWKAGRAHVTHNTFISDIDVAARKLLEYLNNSVFKYDFFGFIAQ
jgi:transposase